MQHDDRKVWPLAQSDSQGKKAAWDVPKEITIGQPLRFLTIMWLDRCSGRETRTSNMASAWSRENQRQVQDLP